ncbi:MAG: glycosyltransferase family 1 protein [Ginsengibacter sp.]
MTIAINTRCFNEGERRDCDSYIFEIFKRVARIHSEHTFVFIYDKNSKDEFGWPVNVIPVAKVFKKHTALERLLWLDIKIPLLLRKYKADILVSNDHCSLTTKVPQCLILNDLSFLHFPLFVKKGELIFYKKYAPRFLKKSRTIITVSNFVKAAIAQRYKTPEDKIKAVLTGVNKIFQPLSLPEKENIKEKFAGGSEYFIYSGEIHPRNNLMNLLKAFSAFKKRQKSNMQLLIISEGKSNDDELLINLRSYKFRDDVKLLTDLSENESAKLIASAYAMVYVPFYENYGTAMLKAMKCDVPVITSTAGVTNEICDDAALYASADDFKDIAVKMMQLFRDEKLRKELIEKGRRQVQKFTWDNTAQLVWDTIKKTAG